MMQARTMELPVRKFPKHWLVGLLLCVVSFAFLYGTTFSHAETRHGEDAVLVRKCMEGDPGPHWFNPQSKYVARWCEIDDERIGYQILKNIDGRWEEVTAFVDQKARKNLVDAIIKYLVESGFIDITWLAG